MINSKRMIFRLALAALLLFAQHVAFAHQAQHAFDHGSLQSQHAGDDNNFHSDLCAFHGDFKALLSALESTPPAPHFSCTAFEQFPQHFPVITPQSQ